MIVSLNKGQICTNVEFTLELSVQLEKEFLLLKEPILISICERHLLRYRFLWISTFFL